MTTRDTHEGHTCGHGTHTGTHMTTRDTHDGHTHGHGTHIGHTWRTHMETHMGTYGDTHEGHT